MALKCTNKDQTRFFTRYSLDLTDEQIGWLDLAIAGIHGEYEVPTILGSDAHISFQIADYERLYPLLAETDFPDELIMNYWPDRFFDYLRIQR